MSKARWFGVALGLAALIGCDENLPESAEPVPGTVLWEHTWSVESSSVQLDDGSTIPIPTDRALLEKIRYGEGGAPPVGDVLEGAELIFEIDGRILVQPAGIDEPEDYGTDYRVLEEGLLRASVRKSIWFKYEYSYDQGTQTLLISPEQAAGDSLLDFILEIISRTLYSGALDSAAARVTDVLFEDPRVSEGIDEFLHSVLAGAIEQIPIQAPADVTAWLIQLLRETGIVSPEVPDAVLEAIVGPIVEELLPLDRPHIVDQLVTRLLESDLVAAITPERVERVLRFALYRRLLATGQDFSSVESVSLLLRSR